MNYKINLLGNSGSVIIGVINYFMIGFEVWFMRGNLCLVLKI